MLIDRSRQIKSPFEFLAAHAAMRSKALRVVQRWRQSG
jgi:hypothetical protein